MKFWEAMRELEAGKKVKCKNSNHILDKKYILNGCFCPINKETFFSEWELYEESERTFSFLEILPLLKKGKGIRRLNWDKSRFTNQDDEIFLHGTEIVGITDLFVEDFEANDWVEVKE